MVAVDATNLSPRVECSGAPIRVRMIGQASHSTAAGGVALGLQFDGAQVDGTTTLSQIVAATVNVPYTVLLDYTTTPTAGSHVIAPTWSTGVATATLFANAGGPLHMTVEEIVRPSADNT